MDFIKLDFSDNLYEAALDAIRERSILIFPTHASASAARLLYQSRWALQELLWVSMEDFKHMLLCMPQAVLEDEKRLLCLHQVIQTEDREHFHLNSYADLVSWGTQLFQFCSELCEANIPILEMQERVNSANLKLRLWQEDNVARIAQILQRYRHFIQAKGFDDRIFHPGAAEALQPFTGYRIISVNQYYYSALEKALLHQCELAGNEILLFYHGVDVNEATWELRPLQLATAWQALSHKPEIKLYDCESEHQVALSFLALNSEHQPCAIIDSHFTVKDYAAYFEPARLRLPQNLPISDTTWYRMQRILLEILHAMQESQGFIPLRIIMKYFIAPKLLLPLCPEWQKEDFVAFEQELFHLHRLEILYLDLNVQAQFTEPQGRLYQFCLALTTLLNEIMQISSIAELANLLNSALSMQRFSSVEELQKTDLQPQLWSAMANFSATESLGLVSSWADIFEMPAIGIFELWLDYVKSVQLKLKQIDDFDAVWEISNLLDARNRSFDRLAIFNLVEGILPQAPSPIWLLHEQQRKMLGLKTYDDIRDWERYYFFRLLFAAKEVQLFSYTDADKAIESSSLIGELQEFIELPGQPCYVDEELILRAWQFQMRGHHTPNLLQAHYHSPVDAEFFRLPAAPTQDFGSSRDIRCSSYNLQLFTYNPFVWYIRALRRIDERRILRREVISPTLFGTLLHAYFASVLGTQDTKHQDLNALDALFTDTSSLSQSLRKLIHSPDFKYKMPKNYNADYLSSIICDRLADSLKEFYRRFLRKRFSDTPFTLIPEEASMSEAERRFKTLTELCWQDATYRIQIRGQADLRIESPGLKCIVDFKTGAANATQLIFYEWQYYLLEDPALDPELVSYFWMILDMRVADTAQTSSKKRLAYLEDINAALAECLECGYQIAAKSADRLSMRELSRSDLYLPGAYHETL